MGILIHGLDLPENEPLIVKINPDGTVSTTWKNNYKKYTAIPVPPHGDMISRETAKLYHSYLVDERTGIRVPAIPLSVLNVVPAIIQAEPEEEE